MSGVRGLRTDVLTDAGRRAGDVYPIALNLSATEATTLTAILKRHGWVVELAIPIEGSERARACDAARSRHGRRSA